MQSPSLTLALEPLDESACLLGPACCRLIDGPAVPAASYVFLLEPSLNVAVEQQALARVHRFGQTRPVRIVRFICHDTVEVSPLQLEMSIWPDVCGVCSYKAGSSSAPWGLPAPGLLCC